MKRTLVAGALMAAAFAAGTAAAKDYGQQGAVFPVLETDLLSVIQAKLKRMESTGAIERANKELARRTEARVRRPQRVAGVYTAASSRSWSFDPTITVLEDIRDNKGRVVVARGTRVNPLDTIGLRQRLVFLDGDDPAQLAWALRTTTAINAKLILIGGSPFDAMKSAQRRFFFDQGGTLTKKFGIEAVPATVEQSGRVLKVSEIALQQKNGGRK